MCIYIYIYIHICILYIYIYNELIGDVEMLCIAFGPIVSVGEGEGEVQLQGIAVGSRPLEQVHRGLKGQEQSTSENVGEHGYVRLNI